MERECDWVDQPPAEAVDVATWSPDDEFEVYPEGARDKSLICSPDPSMHTFLIPGHRYLFKRANRRYADQFWTEIIAYLVGRQLGVTVPPAFVAWNSSNAMCGALIEWFLDYPGKPKEHYIPGGDYMTRMIPGYERKKGEQHNVDSIIELMDELSSRGTLVDEWRKWWCDTFLFDALIGNTDRHQDNWGLLWIDDSKARMAPVFDNGTSLGHEIFPAKMLQIIDPIRLESYIERGCHHVRWHIGDDRRAQHAALIRGLCEQVWGLREHVRSRLSAFNLDTMRGIIRNMTAFDIPFPLTRERAEFVCRLIEARYRTLVDD